MDETQIKKLISRAKIVACKKGFKREKDDFSQYAIIKLLAGRKATLEQLLIDYMRDGYSRKTKKRHFENLEYQEWTTPHLDKHFASEGLDQILKILEKVDKSSRLRTMIVLKYLWGFKDLEIAYCFNVTQGRISQLMHSAFSYIKEHYSKGD